jgi:HSP20 family protein
MSFHLFNPDNAIEVSRESTNLPVSSWQSSIAVIPIDANLLLLDVYEDDQTYWIVMDLPGAREEEIIVKVSQNYLEIEAEIPTPSVSNKRGEHILLRERCYGHFHRKVRLPQPINDNKAEARYQDGVLTILLPKKDTISDKIISVKTGT